METKLYTLRDVCEILGLKPHVLAYVLSTKKVPKPMRLSGRRLFSVEDLTASARC
jgi:DNA-binding transcriptional MerR regulator